MSLVAYEGNSPESIHDDEEIVENQKLQIQLKMTLVCAAPEVSVVKPKEIFNKNVEVCEKLYGPNSKNISKYQNNNILTGHIEENYISNFEFDKQYNTFKSFGYAKDPSRGSSGMVRNLHGPGSKKIKVTHEKSVFEKTPKREKDKRKRLRNCDASDLEGYLGPWGKYVDEETVSKPSEDDQKDIDVYLEKMKSRKGEKMKKDEEQEPTYVKESFELHIPDPLDYQGRSFIDPKSEYSGNPKHDYIQTPGKCYAPSRCIHTWKGHTKAVSKMLWFPKSAHLILTASVDTTIKLWEVYKSRRCVMTFNGHNKAVRDICFNRSGKQFASCGYDKYVRLWDTEKGICVSRFHCKRIPYCVKFNPRHDNQNLILIGTASKKIICYNTNTKTIIQEYDRHMGAINAIEFIDFGKRFVSSSDDKSLRIWEWNIPVDFKCISDPTMHAAPAMTLSPNEKYLITQSMDNTILTYNALQVCRKVRKKTFKGHMVSGYACTLDFSPSMSHVVSGDADGKVFFWDWKTTNVVKTLKAHEGVCGNVMWHPYEASRVITAGWDGLMKYWE
ncbi:Pre-mRNA-processing factor 17 [Intoshia linei]|uniref:Pre-mRNA-processing factor 17 n=1 Tax=Intoshia linei TaxID=1819745 RepID=A0A177B6T6_9BILA|nr:Pre-mRNA-processing factor 17 [Intoshia linei]